MQLAKHKIVGVVTLVLVLQACAMFTTNDPARVALYTAKQTWLAGRETAIALCAKGTVSVENCKKHRSVDAEYTKKHNDAVDLYLAALPVTEKALADIKRLSEEAKALADRINAGGAK